MILFFALLGLFGFVLSWAGLQNRVTDIAESLTRIEELLDRMEERTK